MNNILVFQQIQEKQKKGNQISPFLFLGMNINTVHHELYELIEQVREYYGLPKSYIYRLVDDGESIKITQTRQFFEKLHMSMDYDLQIFVIENVGRLGVSASNSLLKILEEPGPGNIIFLTNASESGILDTILSRVQTVSRVSPQKEQFTEYLEALILQYIEKKDPEILGYYFTKTFEKQDGLLFLYALIEVNKKTGKFSNLLSCIHSDINGISNNNFNAKFIIDKYLIRL